jgi:hypothetical protein
LVLVRDFFAMPNAPCGCPMGGWEIRRFSTVRKAELSAR